MDEFKFEIVEKIGVLSENEKGWRKEINMVSWNDRAAKLDIREWAPNNEKMKKGITLNLKETAELKSLLASIDIPEDIISQSEEVHMSDEEMHLPEELREVR